MLEGFPLSLGSSIKTDCYPGVCKTYVRAMECGILAFRAAPLWKRLWWAITNPDWYAQ